MPRIRPRRAAYNDHPFATDGFSLYVTAGDPLYRKKRIPGRQWVKGTTGHHDLAATSVTKTARVAFDVGSPIVWPIPASYADQDLTFDVRRCKDHVEHETDNFRPARITLDSSRDDATEILGTATELTAQRRAGGVVRLRFRWQPHRDGVQPDLFRATATAGPTSPDDATTTILAGQTIVEIDTPALSDSAPYTYTISAETTGGAITQDLLTGLTVQSDATGPPAPSAGTASAH